MKILHLCLASFYIEGYAYQENIMPRVHKSIGFDVTIVASRVSFNEATKILEYIPAQQYTNRDEIEVIRLEYSARLLSSISKRLRLYKDLYQTLEEIDPDIIFIHGCQFLDIIKVINYKKKNPSVKIIVDNHADYINSATNWISKNILHKIIWRWCAKSLEPYVEKFYGVTPLRCAFLKDMYNIAPKKIELLVMGADDEKINFINQSEIRANLRNKHEIGQNDFLVITGGKIDRSKNVHLLIKAVNNIKNERIKLLIFGTPSPDMKDEIELMSKYKEIISIGWINSNEVYDYFLAADLAVFPGTHSVLWEQAAGCGIPCIFKYWEGMTHVDVGGNCLFLHEESVNNLSELINRVMDDKQLYNMMRQVAIEKAVEIFSYKDIAKRSIDIFNT